MDKWKHHREPPLEIQLPTIAALATHCLVHHLVLVELMDCGLQMIRFANVGDTNNWTLINTII